MKDVSLIDKVTLEEQVLEGVLDLKGNGTISSIKSALFVDSMNKLYVIIENTEKKCFLVTQIVGKASEIYNLQEKVPEGKSLINQVLKFQIWKFQKQWLI